MLSGVRPITTYMSSCSLCQSITVIGCRYLYLLGWLRCRRLVEGRRRARAIANRVGKLRPNLLDGSLAATVHNKTERPLVHCDQKPTSTSVFKASLGFADLIQSELANARDIAFLMKGGSDKHSSGRERVLSSQRRTRQRGKRSSLSGLVISSRCRQLFSRSTSFRECPFLIVINGHSSLATEQSE